MVRKVYVERSKEERSNKAKIFSFVFLVVILAAIGVNHILEVVNNKTTCTGEYSCLVKILGSNAISFFLFFVVWFVLYLIFYNLARWEEVDEKIYRKKKK